MTSIGSERRPETGAAIAEPRPIEETRVLRTASSTNPDGLDLTVAEARAMSPEEFKRTFGVESLDAMPIVGPGFLKQAPRGCERYIRMRPAPKKPGPKDRRQDVIELVVKTPQRAVPEAGGGIAVNPKRFVLKTRNPLEACLEALVFLAREQGRRRRATTWPIERIQSLLCVDVLDTFVEVYLEGPPPEDENGRPKRAVGNSIASIRAFKKAFPELEIGDVGNWINKAYATRAKHRSPQSRRGDLYVVRKGLKEGLACLGVPPGFSPDLSIKDPGRLQKTSWTPDALDRLKAAADRYPFEADGSPKPIVRADGYVYPHGVALRSWEHRGHWRRIIDFLPYTGSRVGRLNPTRWVPPEVEPMDGLPLPRHDRPWIEVLEDEVWYHRDGESRVDSNKKRGPVLIPKEFEPVVRRWFEEDAAEGFEFVFHKPDGSRHHPRQFSWNTFKAIVADAGLASKTTPHHFKDLFVEMGDAAGVAREVMAAAADTTTRTLERKYGPARREALLQRAAETITAKAWRDRGASKTAVADRFAAARARRLGKLSS
ncbi:hypothetical protein [Bradyrhizobium sp. JR18.2]|uniref:hypothetical protein n=1 Tax=Bradyrhizobium sp. JR18.2 TaxID=3156369 RepID=UPI003398DAE4